MVFDGTTASSTESPAITIAGDIISFSLSNKSGSAIEASVGIFFGSSITYILYNEPLAAEGTATCNYVYQGNPIRILPNYKIFVSVSGVTDFYFTII